MYAEDLMGCAVKSTRKAHMLLANYEAKEVVPLRRG